MSGEIADSPESWPVEKTVEHYRGSKVAMVSDWVEMPGADGPEIVQRDRFEHPGAVAALALDDDGRVLLLNQYRHVVGHRLWELPAGIRDEVGEPPVRTAQRELLEEAGFTAERWFALADYFSSPGFCTERIQVFLARGITEVAESDIDFERIHEEADMPTVWLPLEEAVEAAAQGRFRNSATVIGLLAASRAAADGFASLPKAE
ncbi:ADP-ribose pyrophosphatase [Murinocardiopsis flavida]|uniref:ADP-ribose pyrophosphatase n=1 Tax=Murinocardiopsis flavida TaxID=645275 RepID=A0A2P8CNH6_9ACTN|nr:NUDIX hydrolase [Murinocardiopsis flavida]PSK86517.1 ADP-ribose pyrophosphatase [Murinocardiopsis flavida]